MPFSWRGLPRRLAVLTLGGAKRQPRWTTREPGRWFPNSAFLQLSEILDPESVIHPADRGHAVAVVRLTSSLQAQLPVWHGRSSRTPVHALVTTKEARPTTSVLALRVGHAAA